MALEAPVTSGAGLTSAQWHRTVAGEIQHGEYYSSAQGGTAHRCLELGLLFLGAMAIEAACIGLILIWP